MSDRDNPEKYQLQYPHYLDWSRKIWILQRGDQLKSGDKTYRVKEVVKNFVPGSQPTIVLEGLEDD